MKIRAPEIATSTKARSSDDGYSTLELLISLTILSLIAAIGFTSFHSQRSNQSSRSVILAVHAMANLARQSSISSGRFISLNWDFDARTVTYENASKTIVFDEGLNIKVETATQLMSGGKAQIIFNPDGSSTGGNIFVTDEKGITSELNIDWLTGISSLVEGQTQ